jgi:hypothetical protein
MLLETVSNPTDVPSKFTGPTHQANKKPQDFCLGVRFVSAIDLSTNPYGVRSGSAKSNNRSKFVGTIVMLKKLEISAATTGGCCYGVTLLHRLARVKLSVLRPSG